MIATVSSCNSRCEIVYENGDGGKTSKDLVTGATGKFKGVITIKGVLKNVTCLMGTDYLRFRKATESGDREYDSLAFQFHNTVNLLSITVFGERKDEPIQGITMNNWVWKQLNTFNIQISDYAAVKSEYYAIYFSGNYLKFNYANKWDDFDNKRLLTANRIVSDLFCSYYKYIMICPDAVPTMCDSNTPVLKLGSLLTITCKAAGSPILELAWTLPNGSLYSGAPSYLNKNEDVITSKLTIANYSVKDSGIYTCTAENQNYGHRKDKTFDLTYSEEIKVTPPDVTTFTDRNSIKIFVWTVTGWPLEDLVMSCGTAGNVSSLTLNEDIAPSRSFTFSTTNTTTPLNISCGILTGNTHLATTVINYIEDLKISPPDITYYKPKEAIQATLTTSFDWIVNGWPLSNITMYCDTHQDFIKTTVQVFSDYSPKKIFTLKVTNQSIVTCEIASGDKTLETTTITRVGYNCTGGSYGDGNNCLACPSWKTSPAESDDFEDCYNVTSQCIAGNYGVNIDCSPCPDGLTSTDYTVNKQDCFVSKDPSKTMMIIGGSGGGLTLFFLVIILILIVLMIRRRSKTKKTKNKQDSPASAPIPATQCPVNIVSPLDPRAVEDDTLYAQIGPKMDRRMSDNDGLYSKLDNRQRHKPELGNTQKPDLTYATLMEDEEIVQDVDDLYTRVNHEQPGHSRDTDDDLYAQVDKIRRASHTEELYSNMQEDKRRYPEVQADGYTAVEKMEEEEGLYSDVNQPRDCVLQQKEEEIVYAVMDENVFKGRRAEKKEESEHEETLYSTIETEKIT